MVSDLKPFNELKPCPFCGGEAKVLYKSEKYYKNSVVCSFCGVSTPWEHIPAIAISLWNRMERVSDETMKPKRIFVSIPMAHRSNEEILTELGRIAREIREKYGVDTEVVDGWDVKRDEKEPLELLGESLKEMAKCDTVYMAQGWDKARGCRIELMAASEYGKEIIYGDEKSAVNGEMEQAYTDYRTGEKIPSEGTQEGEKGKITLEYAVEIIRKESREQGIAGFLGTAELLEDIAGVIERKAKKKILPIPCTKGYEKWTIKDWFQKINEELDELKEVCLRWSDLDSVGWDAEYADAKDVNDLVEEAADTITAITSMLEAFGIDEHQRQAAQERVNRHNRERGRI